MKPVDQTIMYDPEAPAGKQRGNCWTACIASVLELPIEAVPNFVQIDVDGGQNWFTHTWQWLLTRDLRLKQRTKDDLHFDPHSYFIATGVSPRGNGELRHAVIYHAGQMAHDPHPDRTGLLSLETVYAIVPVEVSA